MDKLKLVIRILAAIGLAGNFFFWVLFIIAKDFVYKYFTFFENGSKFCFRFFMIGLFILFIIEFIEKFLIK